MRVFVTGGAGYIGSAVAHDLVERGHDVIVYDNLRSGHRRAVPLQAQFVRGDIADSTALQQVFKSQRIEAVLHFAALIEAGESMKEPERYFRNNSAATLTLLETMLSHGIRKFVFSSTAALYGEPKRVPILEEDPLLPSNPYGESKLVAERMLAWFSRIHGLRYASLRYFNAAGARGDLGEDHRPESHLIPLVLQVALGKRPAISIYGADYPTPDGTCVRDYIHIADLSLAHLLALEALDNHESIVCNLGNGHGFSVLEVIETARRITGHHIPAVAAPRRLGDPAILVASSEKIRRILGWKPTYTRLEDVIGSAWEWRGRHPDGYTREAEAERCSA